MVAEPDELPLHGVRAGECSHAASSRQAHAARAIGRGHASRPRAERLSAVVRRDALGASDLVSDASAGPALRPARRNAPSGLVWASVIRTWAAAPAAWAF